MFNLTIIPVFLILKLLYKARPNIKSASEATPGAVPVIRYGKSYESRRKQKKLDERARLVTFATNFKLKLASASASLAPPVISAAPPAPAPAYDCCLHIQGGKDETYNIRRWSRSI